MNGTKTTHIWDGANIVMDKTGSASTNEKFIRGVGGTLVARVKSGGTDRYLHNAHGDVVQTVSPSGTASGLNKFDAFGNNVSNEKFGYAGEYRDTETGLIYLRNRYYNPGTGRFISEDPIRDGGNWYVYCGGNPVNRWDPWGYAWTDEDQATYDALGGFWSGDARAFKREIDAATKDWDNADGDVYKENNARYRAVQARQAYYANGYVDDFDYMRGNDIMGLLVTHSVAKFGNHAGIAIIVGSRSDFLDDVTTVFLWGGAVKCVTLGAQELNGNASGTLHAYNNRSDDYNFSKAGAHINLNISKSDATTLMSLDKYFRKNSNGDLKYGATMTKDSATYNSNSYAWSLLRHADLTDPPPSQWMVVSRSRQNNPQLIFWNLRRRWYEEDCDLHFTCCNTYYCGGGSNIFIKSFKKIK